MTYSGCRTRGPFGGRGRRLLPRVPSAPLTEARVVPGAAASGRRMLPEERMWVGKSEEREEDLEEEEARGEGGGVTVVARARVRAGARVVVVQVVGWAASVGACGLCA